MEWPAGWPLGCGANALRALFCRPSSCWSRSGLLTFGTRSADPSHLNFRPWPGATGKQPVMVTGGFVLARVSKILRGIWSWRTIRNWGRCKEGDLATLDLLHLEERRSRGVISRNHNGSAREARTPSSDCQRELTRSPCQQVATLRGLTRTEYHAVGSARRDSMPWSDCCVAADDPCARHPCP